MGPVCYLQHYRLVYDNTNNYRCGDDNERCWEVGAGKSRLRSSEWLRLIAASVLEPFTYRQTDG